MSDVILTVDIQHQVGEDEARERVRRMLAAHDFDDLEPERSRTIEIQGFKCDIRAEIQPERVRVVLVMPRPLRLIRQAIEAQIRDRAREALRVE